MIHEYVTNKAIIILYGAELFLVHRKEVVIVWQELFQEEERRPDMVREALD